MKFDAYTGNGQSALLQEVKGVLQKTYSKSFIKGDGQVIGINFTDGIQIHQPFDPFLTAEPVTHGD